MSTKFSDVNIRGKRFEVEIDGTGTFSAEYNGQKIESKMLADLKAKLENVVKNDRIAPIPFVRWNGEEMVRGKCTGIHYGNRNLIIIIEGEKGFQQTYHLDDALDPEHAEAYGKLCAAAAAAEEARREYESKHAFDMKDRVEDAMKAKGGGQ